jgi:hypothetical protein
MSYKWKNRKSGQKQSRAAFTPERRKSALKKGIETRKAKKYDDGLTTTQRRTQKIKEAAGGRWWIEQYIIGSIVANSNSRKSGIDDE